MSESGIYCNVQGVATNTEKKIKDTFLIADLTTGQTLANTLQVSQSLDKNSILFLISQDLGPDSLGNAPSELTALAVKDALLRIPPTVAPYDRLVAAVEEANNIIWNERKSNPQMKEALTTVTAVLIQGDQAFIAEVGYSRAYLIRGDKIKQLTTDQVAESQISAENLIPIEQKRSYRNLALQAIGKAEAVKVAISMFQLLSLDILLLSTNSLSKIIEQDKLLELTLRLPSDNACKELASLVSTHKLQENVTSIIAQFGGEALSNKQPSSITNSVQILSRFDPEEKVEKSHKRTLMLGDMSLTNKYYKGEQGSSENTIPIKSISPFPESNTIKKECETLLEHLSYCNTLLSIKPDQLRYASKWMETQGYGYSNLGKRLRSISAGLEHIQKIRQIMDEIMKDLEDDENFGS
jgi:serine/threonine protein phosphatase PrpC